MALFLLFNHVNVFLFNTPFGVENIFVFRRPLPAGENCELVIFLGKNDIFGVSRLPTIDKA